jgi:hypothetical protein
MGKNGSREPSTVRSAKPYMQWLQTKAFSLTKTQGRGKTIPNALTGSCGDNKEHHLVRAWSWQHQWVFNDPTGKIMTPTGFSPQFINAPHLAVDKSYLPFDCRGEKNKSRLVVFYAACAHNHKYLYNPEKALPFHLARGEHGVMIISDTTEYDVLLKHLPGWLLPLSKDQYEVLNMGHFFSLHGRNLLFGPLSLLNHSCVAYCSWNKEKAPVFYPPKRFGCELGLLTAVRIDDRYGNIIPLRKGDKSLISIGQEMTARYCDVSTGPPNPETWDFVCSCARCKTAP